MSTASHSTPDVGLGLFAKGCLCLLALFVVMAILGPAISPRDPSSISLSDAFGGPTAGHPLGFDANGRDLLSRLLDGARLSFAGPLAITLIATTLGAAVAVVSAWRGGWVDSAIGTALDLVFAFPAILMAILAVAVFGKGITAAVIALGIAYLPYTARLLRSAAVRERSLDYVNALSVQGVSGFAICTRHIIPNLMPLIVAQGTLCFGYAMIDLAAVSFLGLGAQPPAVDWGSMVQDGRSGILEGQFWPALAPGILLVLAVTSFNVLGERLEERAEQRAAMAGHGA